jgi:hypothetical protein
MMLVVLIGISALSVDMGYYRYQQRVQQAATDSAALAAGQASFFDSKNGNNAQNAMISDATQNGFTNGTGNVTVTLNPTYTDTGNCAGGCYQVSITKAYPIFFGSIFKGFGKSHNQRNIQTFAAAKLAAVSGGCLISLGLNPVSSTSNGAKINGPNCGIADADCTTVNGGTNINVASWTVNAACGASNTWSGGTSQFTPALPPTDPCSLSAQCQTLANATAAQLNLSSLTTPSCTVTASTAGNPLVGGCYSSPTFKNKTLSPGLYVIVGTATFNGTVTGTNGVTFYFTQGAKYNDQTNATVNLTAPTSGDISSTCCSAGEEGVLMYQTKIGSPFATSLQATIDWIGLSYMPNWDVTFNGHTQTIQGNLTVDSFRINGGGNQFTLLPGSGSTQGGPSEVVLAE